MRIDHVTIAGRDLATLEGRLRSVGLESIYGGAHSNGATHMSITAFADGSYIELISTIEPQVEGEFWWSRFIAEDAGLCAWAVGVEDIGAEAARIAELGVHVRGPMPMGRKRPDGRAAEWDLAYLGDGEPGQLLPFLIEDRTRRDARVPAPTAEDIGGIAAVVLGVPDLEPAASLFERVFGWPVVSETEDDEFGAKFAYLGGGPAILAAPAAPGWLSERISRFGPAPCAILLDAPDAEATPSWLPQDRLAGTRIGFARLTEGE